MKSFSVAAVSFVILCTGPIFATASTTNIADAEALVPGYIPQSWFVLPESAPVGIDAAPLAPGADEADNPALNRSFDDVLNGSAEALARIDTSTEKHWKLTSFRTALAISTSGLLGVLTLKGQPASEVHWRRVTQNNNALAAPPPADIADPATPLDVDVTSTMTPDDVMAAVEPAYQTALATRRVRHPQKLRERLHAFALQFHSLVEHLDRIPSTRHWWVRGFRFDLVIGASGKPAPFASVGGDLRFRFEWRRIMPVAPTSVPALAVTTPLSPMNPKLDKIASFIAALAQDIEVASEGALAQSGFKPRLLRIGLGIGVGGDIAMVKASGSAVFNVFFESGDRLPVPPAPPVSATELPNSFLLAKERIDGDVTFANANKIAFADFKEEQPNPTGPINNIVYKVPRQRFVQGLQKAFKISQFFLKRAARRQGTHTWEVYQIDNIYDVSITGSLGLASLSGLGTAKLRFIKEP